MIVGRRRFIVGLVLFAGCGRFGFTDEVATPDANPSAPADGAAPTMLACTAPSRAQVGTIDALSAFGTASGIAMVTSTAGAIQGWTYDVTADGSLALGTQGAALGTSETDSIAAIASGTTVLVASLTGSPPTGTTLAAFDGALASDAAPSTRTGEFMATGPLAPASPGFAYVTEDATTREVDARVVDTSGADASVPVAIVDGTAKASEPSIIATPHGYALAFVSTTPTPNVAQLELLGSDLHVATAPVTGSTSTDDPEHPLVRYAPASDTYLLAWMEKSATTDGIWIAIYDGGGNLVVPGKQIASSSYTPAIATDGTGFWIVWKSYAPAPDHLDGAHVAADGSTTPRPVTMSGGDAAQWTMVDRFGQPMLVWVETGGAGPDLYVDPMCP